jgi:hypothetical protein
MRLILGRNASMLDVLKPVLLEDPEVSREEFVQNVKQGITSYPDNWFVIGAFEELKGKPVCYGYMIAVSVPAEQFTYVVQAWADPKAAERITRASFDVLQKWSELRGKTEIRMETRRDHTAFIRKWGFQPISTLMSLKWECDENGKRSINQEVRNVDTGSDRSESGAGPVSDGQAEQPAGGGPEPVSGRVAGDQPGLPEGASGTDAEQGSAEPVL